MTAPLVLGRSGQLATHLRAHLPNAAFWGRDDLDLRRPTSIREAIGRLKPSIIVNAAAYTAVDMAETESIVAWRINAEAAAEVAVAAAELGVPLVHVSTDYVFDGRKIAPYEVTDAVSPLNVYGATKLAGELAVRSVSKEHWILRTSWVFSEHGANFVKTIVRLACTSGNLRIIADQRGIPTYAGDLAALIERLIERRSALAYGTYHTVGGKAVSWHSFAKAIVERALEHELILAKPLVIPITSSEYPTPARRPSSSELRASPELSATGVRFDWELGLEHVLAAMRSPQPQA